MTPDRRKLARLKRLESLRARAKTEAAQTAADAETALTRLSGLGLRVRALQQSYAGRQDLTDGLALAQLHGFVTGLAAIDAATRADAARAQSHADDCQSALAEAEQRRSIVADRLNAHVRTVRRKGQGMALAVPARTVGTEFER